MARKLSDDGLAGENTGGKVVLINPGDCLILLGSVVGCFEGIGLVLPIQVNRVVYGMADADFSGPRKGGGTNEHLPAWDVLGCGVAEAVFPFFFRRNTLASLTIATLVFGGCDSAL